MGCRREKGLSWDNFVEFSLVFEGGVSGVYGSWIVIPIWME